MALVLIGTLVTFDPARPEALDGAIYIDDDGVIEAVLSADAAAPVGYEGARRVASRGVVYPGLIDLHNHLAYNWRPLWPPPQAEPYTSRSQWPDGPAYESAIRIPTAVMGKVAPRGLLKFVEVKAIVGGVTAIQGSAKLKGVYDGWLARNVEDESFGTGTNTVFQNVRPLGERDFEKARSRMVGGNSYLYHLAEGTSPALVGEFDDLERHDCLQPGLVAIHATALGPSQFDRWGAHPGSLVWSPLSNLWLYRATTDVVAARDAGIRVCLGADWAPSGSKNLLGELKVADLWNRTALGAAFSDGELCEMVTANPADALSWGDRIGRLVEGRLADVVVMRRRHLDPYRNLIESTERDVRLVMVGGRPIYGVPSLIRTAGAMDPEAIAVAGQRRMIAMTSPGMPPEDVLTWKEAVAELRAGRGNPVAALASAAARAEEFGGDLEVLPDLPEDQATSERSPAALTDALTATFPPIDSLAHDTAFFRTVGRATIPGGALDGLDNYYR